MIKVLIVDDDEDSLELMAQFLKLKDISIVGEAKDGKTAVEMYKELKPDLIITDMKMPEYDGNYVINEIKKLDPNGKIIVVTAYQEYKFNQDNVSAVLIKPYKIEELVLRIREIEDLLV